MAKKDDETQHADEPKAVAAPNKAEHGDEEVKSRKHLAPWPLITIGVFATVLVMALMAAVWLQLFSLSKSGMHDNERVSTNESRYGEREWGRGERGGMRGGMSRPVAAGVVTAINGDTITVSGSGKQVSVKQSDDMTISGDESDIAVNDTVVIFGTKNDDGSIAATRIVVRNSGLFENTTREKSDERRPAPAA